MEYVEIARAESERGELVLRERRPENGPTSLELRANGVFVMDTARGEHRAGAGRARRSAAVDDPRAVVVGGLGLGFTMHEVLADSRVEKCAVVEIEQALVDWMRDGTIPHGPALLADERVTVVVADVAVALAEARPRRTTWSCSTSTTAPATWCTRPTPRSTARRSSQPPAPRCGPAARWSSGRPPRRPSCRRRCARCSAAPTARARRAAAGPRRAVLALRRAGTVRRMTRLPHRARQHGRGPGARRTRCGGPRPSARSRTSRSAAPRSSRR